MRAATRGFSAVGFPYGSDGNPIYAYSYTPFGTPSSSDGKSQKPTEKEK